MEQVVIKKWIIEDSEAIKELVLSDVDGRIILFVCYNGHTYFAHLVCNNDVEEIIDLVVLNKNDSITKEASDYIQEEWPGITITKKDTLKISIGATISSLNKNEYIKKVDNNWI